MRRRGASLLLSLVIASAGLVAAEHPALARARALYNAGEFDEAIAAATIARSDPASADAAALVIARSHLERYRLHRSDPDDLAAAREALAAVRSQQVSPRDRLDLLVGFGQALYLAGTFGAAAELFETALGRASSLPGLSDRERSMLLDWWAQALDRQAQVVEPARRPALLQLVLERMGEVLRTEPGNATANYWLVVAARGVGDTDRAWHAAIAAWVRASLQPDTREALRADLDRFVTTILIPERTWAWPSGDRPQVSTELLTQWESLKAQWP